MKRALGIFLLLLLPTLAGAQTVDQITDYGYRGFEGNELTVGSRVDDPAKFRCTSPITEHGGGGCVISFNMHRALGEVAFGGRQIEIGMVRVEESEDVRGSFSPKAEFNVMLNDGTSGDDSAMRKPLAFTWNAVTRFEPALAASFASHIAPYLPGGSQAVAAIPFKMVSQDGGFELIIQNETGNFIIYNLTHQPAPCAIWSAFTGKLPCQ